MNRLFFFYFIIGILLFSSCKKEEEKKKTTDGTPKIFLNKPADGKTWYIGTLVKLEFSVAATNGIVSKVRQVFATKKYDNNAEEPLLIFDYDMANNVFRKSDTTFSRTVTVHVFDRWFRLRNIEGTETYTIKVVTEDGFSTINSVTMNVSDVSLLPEVSFVKPSKDTIVSSGSTINLIINCTSNSTSQVYLQQFKIMLALDNQAPNPFVDSMLIPNKTIYSYKSLYKTRDTTAGTEKLVVYLTDESAQTKVKELVITTVK